MDTPLQGGVQCPRWGTRKVFYFSKHDKRAHDKSQINSASYGRWDGGRRTEVSGDEISEDLESPDDFFNLGTQVLSLWGYGDGGKFEISVWELKGRYMAYAIEFDPFFSDRKDRAVAHAYDISDAFSYRKDYDF
jgi:hypothetical protein